MEEKSPLSLEQIAQIKKKIEDLILEELKPIVTKIESSIPTTRNHYGNYMAFIGGAPSHLRTRLAELLIIAGANKQGVVDALKLSL